MKWLNKPLKLVSCFELFFSKQIVKFAMSPVENIKNIFVRSGNYVGVDGDDKDEKVVIKVVEEQSAVIDLVKKLDKQSYQ